MKKILLLIVMRLMLAAGVGMISAGFWTMFIQGFTRGPCDELESWTYGQDAIPYEAVQICNNAAREQENRSTKAFWILATAVGFIALPKFTSKQN